MSTVWVRLMGTPTRQFVGNVDTLPVLDAGQARHALLDSVGIVRSDAFAETANISIALRNGSGECSALYATLPPLGAAVQVMAGNDVVFAGSVTAVHLAELCTLEVEA